MANYVLSQLSNFVGGNRITFLPKRVKNSCLSLCPRPQCPVDWSSHIFGIMCRLIWWIQFLSGLLKLILYADVINSLFVTISTFLFSELAYSAPHSGHLHSHRYSAMFLFQRLNLISSMPCPTYLLSKITISGLARSFGTMNWIYLECITIHFKLRNLCGQKKFKWRITSMIDSFLIDFIMRITYVKLYLQYGRTWIFEKMYHIIFHIKYTILSHPNFS